MTAVTATARHHEHVNLTSDELEQVEVGAIEAELTQSGARQHLELFVFNEVYLGIRRRRTGRAGDEYWLNLAFLDPTPVRRLDRAWVVLAGVCGLAAVISFPLAHAPFAEAYRTALLIASPALLIAGLASLGNGLVRYWSELIFLTRHGRVEALRIRRDLPDRQRLGHFLQRLATAARVAYQRQAGHRSYYLRDEMKEHRRLHEAGVVPDEDYEAAKTRVLQAHG